MNSNQIEINKISDQVYILKDKAEYCSNLVIGTERALLFDTGAGIEDLRGTVETLTRLPLLVINSHGHFDHVGGNYQFDTVYLRREDMPFLDMYTQETVQNWIRHLAPYENLKEHPEGFRTWDNTKPLEFEEFNLGNLECKVISLQGHSKGSVGIFIPELKLLLSGDALTPVMCMMFPEHMSLEAQRETLEKAQSLEITHFLTSHHTKSFDRSIITRMITCIDHAAKGRWGHGYQYPFPPFTKGKMYVDSIEDEPVALIVEEEYPVN